MPAGETCGSLYWEVVPLPGATRDESGAGLGVPGATRDAILFRRRSSNTMPKSTNASATRINNTAARFIFTSLGLTILSLPRSSFPFRVRARQDSLPAAPIAPQRKFDCSRHRRAGRRSGNQAQDQRYDRQHRQDRRNPCGHNGHADESYVARQTVWHRVFHCLQSRIWIRCPRHEGTAAKANAVPSPAAREHAGANAVPSPADRGHAGANARQAQPIANMPDHRCLSGSNGKRSTRSTRRQHRGRAVAKEAERLARAGKARGARIGCRTELGGRPWRRTAGSDELRR